MRSLDASWDLYTRVVRGELLEWTVRELRRSQDEGHPSARPLLDAQIELLGYGMGETLLHWILDPALEAEGIEVVVR